MLLSPRQRQQAVRISCCQPSPGEAQHRTKQSFTFEFGHHVHKHLDHFRDAPNTPLHLWGLGFGCFTSEGNNRERSSEPSHQPGPGGKQRNPYSHRNPCSHRVPAISIGTPPLGGVQCPLVPGNISMKSHTLSGANHFPPSSCSAPKPLPK